MLEKRNILTRRRKDKNLKIELIMNLLKKILIKLFNRANVEPKTPYTAKDCDILDTVWIEDNGTLYSGFIWEKTRRRLLVSYYKENEGFVDVSFVTTGLSNETKIEKNNLILYFQKPCYTD